MRHTNIRTINNAAEMTTVTPTVMPTINSIESDKDAETGYYAVPRAQ